MSFIVVPFDYNRDLYPNIVPICIADTDSKGIPIHREWVEYGVVPVADPLRRISQRVLHDAWRVSEITEPVVHSLSGKYGENLGADPSRRVLNGARWYAEDLRAGGRRARRKTEVELFNNTLERLQDPHDPISDLEAKDTLNQILEALDRRGHHDIAEVALMMKWGCTAQEFEHRFQKSRNTISQRFYRGARRVVAAARITW
jgi:hypothetical protein